jgi:hypothetical protein
MILALLACPDCPAGVEARARAFGAGFWPTLALVLLPLALSLSVALWRPRP